MANKDFERLIKLGEWLEKYLNPNIKAWEYQELIKDVINAYNLDFILRNELSFKFIDIMCAQSIKVQKILGNKDMLENLWGAVYGYDDVINESTFDEKYYNIFLLDTENNRSVRMLLIPHVEIFKVIDKIYIEEIIKDKEAKHYMDLSGNANGVYYYQIVDDDEASEEECRIPIIKYHSLDFIRFKWLSNYAFKKIIRSNELWSQTFENLLSVKVKNTPPARHFKKIYEQSLAVFEAINFKDGRAYKCTTFNSETRDYMTFGYGKYSFFPWGPIVSKIVIDFLMLGGQEYYLFCEYCGRFTVIRRKGRKKFCSDICRTTYRNANISNQN